MSKEWAVDSDTGLTVKPSGPFSVGISGYLFHSLHLGANQHALLCLMAPLLPDISSPFQISTLAWLCLIFSLKACQHPAALVLLCPKLPIPRWTDLHSGVVCRGWGQGGSRVTLFRDPEGRFSVRVWARGPEGPIYSCMGVPNHQVLYLIFQIDRVLCWRCFRNSRKRYVLGNQKIKTSCALTHSSLVLRSRTVNL